MRGRGPRAGARERQRGAPKATQPRWREVGEAEVKRDRPSLLQGPRLVQSGTARLLLHAPRGRTTYVDTTTARTGTTLRARGPSTSVRQEAPGCSPSDGASHHASAPRVASSHSRFTATKFRAFARAGAGISCDTRAAVSCPLYDGARRPRHLTATDLPSVPLDGPMFRYPADQRFATSLQLDR